MNTTDRMQKMLVAIALGEDPKPENEEEENFIPKVQKDLDENSGMDIRIPPEWPE